MRKRTCLALVAVTALVAHCATRFHDTHQWAQAAAYSPTELRAGESGYICPSYTVAWGGDDAMDKALDHWAEYQDCELQVRAAQ